MNAERSFFDGRIVLHNGDCRDVLRTLAENSVDSVVTDPPYHLTSIVKRFGGKNAAPAKHGTDGAVARASKGFLGKQWDGGDIAFQPDLWAEVLRVLKPGGYILAFSGCRTYHRMACAIEDAGFVTHPMLAWVFGSGFPKAQSVSKQIDKSAGVQGSYGAFKSVSHAEMAAAGHCNHDNAVAASNSPWMDDPAAVDRHCRVYEPSTSSAREWDGWFYGGQSLKPALEPIYFGQKPLSEKTGAANVLKHGVGAIFVDGARVRHRTMFEKKGRWPANLLHDGSEEVRACFPESKAGGSVSEETKSKPFGKIFGERDRQPYDGYCDTGSAARFFYCAKADADDRLGSKHPTVKPLDLIQWLVRLVTPPAGISLDPFAGTGTLGEAALREGFRATLIEREAEYIEDIERRMALALAGPDTRAHGTMRARNKPRDVGPLFMGEADE